MPAVRHSSTAGATPEITSDAPRLHADTSRSKPLEIAQIAGEQVEAQRALHVWRPGASIAQGSGCVSWEGGAAIGYRLDLAAARLDLDYLADGRAESDAITLCSTPCSLGGSRWWARCPSCDRRIALLYFGAGGFRCRGCHGLVYPSTRETRFSRACRRAQKLRRRVGATPGIGDPLPSRPRGMWRRTFDRLRDDIAVADMAALCGARASIDRLTRSVERSSARTRG